MASQQVPAPFQSASLYVGDLIPEVTESTLFDLFSKVGPVASIRVCRDSIYRRSLGYAYVNFHNVHDAELALDTMNFQDIAGKPCRIMWSQRDPSLRKTGLGNVFVRNLAPSIDNKALYDTFSVFGNILSCKVATDGENGASKGYGYVHFETGEAADDAIQKFNGMLIEDMEVSVCHFVRRQERSVSDNWTNVYIKHFPTSFDEAKIRELFAPYGTLQSVYIASDETGKSKAFGFVNFIDHEAADKAVAELNGKVLTEGENTYTFYASKAQKKTERARLLKNRQETLNMEKINKFQGMNLYVKNISETVTDEQFKEAFLPYGQITSARIMRENDDVKTSKGFGFVCFTDNDEATKAQAEMNGKPLGGKPLYVAIHQRKEQRKAQLAATFAPQNMRYQGPVAMPYMAMYGFPGQQAPPRGNVPFPTYPQGQVPRGAPGNMAPRGFPRPGPGFYPPVPGVPGQFPPQAQGGFKGPRGFPAPGQPGAVPQSFIAGQPQGARRPAPQGYPVPQGNAPRGQAPVKFNNQARNQGMMPAAPQPMMVPAPAAQQPSSAMMEFSQALLAQQDINIQKNMIGEKLYPLIFKQNQQLAGKITGMLLEMENSELLHLIESPDALTSKINEAISVLNAHLARAGDA